MVGLAALLVVPAVADAVIEATRQPDGSFRLTLEVDETIGVGTAQQMLLPMAVQLCDGLPPHFGTYEFKARQVLDGQRSGDSFVLLQDIECGGAERAEDKASGRELGDAERTEFERVGRCVWPVRTDPLRCRSGPPTGAGSRAPLADVRR